MQKFACRGECSDFPTESNEFYFIILPSFFFALATATIQCHVLESFNSVQLVEKNLLKSLFSRGID